MPGPPIVSSPGVQATRNGVEVTDGTHVRATLGLLGGDPDSFGLRIIGPGGTTTIIDGTSDVFKIVATNTLTVPAVGTVPVMNTASVTLATGLTYSPASMWFQQDSLGSDPTPVLVVTTAGAVSQYNTGATAKVTGGNQTFLEALAFSILGSVSAYTFRYYVLVETGY